MIHAVMIFNTSGVTRLSKFYTPLRSESQSLINKIFSLVSSRPASLCNFLDVPELNAFLGERIGGDVRVVYRFYATLYFVFVVDSSESELGILDLIQVFVKSLDNHFQCVCELDLVFYFDEVHYVLAEVIQGGLVLETDIDEIEEAVAAAAKARKQSFSQANPLALGTSTGPRTSTLQTPLGWLTNRLTGAGSR